MSTINSFLTPIRDREIGKSRRETQGLRHPLVPALSCDIRELVHANEG